MRIAPSHGKGHGAFAAQRLEPPLEVGQYVGELLLYESDKEARYGVGNSGLVAANALAWQHEWSQERQGRGVSVTGGYVYRGSKIAGLRGWYVFGDYVSGQIWGLQQEGGELTGHVDLTPMLAGEAGKGAVPGLATFAEDSAGELYVMSLSQGTVFRIDPAN